MQQKKSTIKIAIAGAAETGHCGVNSLDQAKALGREAATHNAILVTGATTGFPLWAAMGARDAGGTVIGFSPAASLREHTEVYRLPDEHTDMLVYTGFGHAGKDLLMVRSADAVLFGCGNVPTVNEFTIALQEKKVIGILQGDWHTDELLAEILKQAETKENAVIFDTDPRRLIEQVIKKVKSA